MDGRAIAIQPFSSEPWRWGDEEDHPPPSGGPSHDLPDIDEVVLCGVMSHMAAFFDLFLWLSVALLVFPQLMFPFLDPLAGTLLALGVVALVVPARPMGFAVSAAVERRYGVAVRLVTAWILGSAFTLAMVFLPGYDLAGVGAPVLLALIRVCRGMAEAGVWDGLPAALAVHTPPGKHRRYRVLFPSLGALLAVLVTAGLFRNLLTSISPDEFLDWGWRYPFMVSAAMATVAFVTRLRLAVIAE